MYFGEKMKEHRKALKMKQDDLARLTGMSRASISYYENEERVPDIYSAAEIARVLKFDLGELFRTTEKPIVEIYREGPVKYRVIVGGKEIENLKSFSVQISNERKCGVIEAPHYTTEIYLPIKAPERRQTEE